MAALNPAYKTQGTRVLPLAYGYVLGQGDKVFYFTAEDGLKTEVYLLGKGEWDGPHYFSMGGVSHLFRNVVGFAIPNNGTGLGGTTSGFLIEKELHFHSGAYTPIGLDPSLTSVGPFQAYDPWLRAFPSVIPPQALSGIAYYVVQGGGAVPVVPIPNGPYGIWRSTRCRTFDAFGNVTGYSFTTNPTWHFVDATLRYKVKPQQPSVAGLSDAEKACFNWDSVVTHAARNAQMIEGSSGVHPILSGSGTSYPNNPGVPRFVGNYIFAADSTLTNIQETILRCCRSFQRINGRRIELIGDDPRAAVFFFGANHLIPGSLNIGKKNVSKAPNIYIGKYRDLQIPAVAIVESAAHTNDSAGNPITSLLIAGINPMSGANRPIVLGGCLDSTFDGEYQVNMNETLYTPSGVPNPIPNQIVLTQQQGASASTTGGFLGTNDARFSPRAPTNVQHRSHQQSVGQQAPGLTPQPRLVPVEYDLGNMTYDQANRLMKFERDRHLGMDQPGWVAPYEGSVAGYLESIDENGSALVGVQEGDLINIDDWVTPEFAGVYEVMQRRISAPSNDGNGNATLGEVRLDLLQYQPNAFTDYSDTPDATYQSVPNSGLPLFDFPVIQPCWTIQSTFTIVADSSGNLDITIPDLAVQIAGQVGFNYYPNFAVNGVPANTQVLLYVDTQNMVGGVLTPSYGFEVSYVLQTIVPGRVVIFSGSLIATSVTSGTTTTAPAPTRPISTFY